MNSKRIAARGLVFDTCFHPTQELLAVGTIEGLISINDHDETPMEYIWTQPFTTSHKGTLF
jgi:hypothetical protein